MERILYFQQRCAFVLFKIHVTVFHYEALVCFRRPHSRESSAGEVIESQKGEIAILNLHVVDCHYTIVVIMK